MVTLHVGARLFVYQLLKAFSSFKSKSIVEKKTIVKMIITEHLIAIISITGLFLILSGCVLVPQKGRIITIGPEMQKGLSLLSSTPTGKKLIHKARRSTKGSPIFLTSGYTEKNGLIDKKGNSVVGVTRTYFKNIANHFVFNGVFVTSNKDFLKRPEFIALNIAFELENVIYGMKNPGIEFSDDSPMAWQTVESVAFELGLISN